jgi:hypothetical protein
MQVISGRARRVLVYTLALLLAPCPAMPFIPGTREFAAGVLVSGIILSVASYQVFRGELRVATRPLLGYKLLAASFITLLAGLALLAGASAYLAGIYS